MWWVSGASSPYAEGASSPGLVAVMIGLARDVVFFWGTPGRKKNDDLNPEFSGSLVSLCKTFSKSCD